MKQCCGTSKKEEQREGKYRQRQRDNRQRADFRYVFLNERDEYMYERAQELHVAENAIASNAMQGAFLNVDATTRGIAHLSHVTQRYAVIFPSDIQRSDI